MEKKLIEEAIKNARSSAPKRNFKQSVDLVISLRDLDLKKPEHKIKDEIMLPFGLGKSIKIGAIVEGESAEAAKHLGLEPIINKTQLVSLAQQKTEAKKLVNSVNMFVAQSDLMADVGKSLGTILGPRNKMPKPLPPKGDIAPIVERLKKMVSVRIKDQPVIHCIIGNEEMEDVQLAVNAEAVLNSIKKKLPKDEKNIRHVFIKLTMGPSVRVRGEK